jgi:hypothetical protein
MDTHKYTEINYNKIAEIIIDWFLNCVMVGNVIFII